MRTVVCAASSPEWDCGADGNVAMRQCRECARENEPTTYLYLSILGVSCVLDGSAAVGPVSGVMSRRVLRRAKLPQRRSNRLRLLRRSLFRAARKRPASPATAVDRPPPSKSLRLGAPSVSTVDQGNGELQVVHQQAGCSSDAPLPAHAVFPFGLLPPHIQKHIFQFLPLRCRVRLERVSRWWRRLLGDCWEHVTSADIPATVTDCFNIRPIDDNHVCGFLRKCGRHLRKIDFFFPHFHIGEHVLFSISQRCAKLRELRLMTDVNGVAMTFLLKAYSHQLARLESLSISYQAEDGPGIHNGLRAVARSMTRLDTFRLDCYNMPPSVGALFPNSQHMRLYSLLLRQPPAPSRIDQNRWKWVTAEYVDQFLAYLADIYPQLEELDLSLDTNYRVNETLALKHMRRIGSERPLKRLNLRLSCLFEDYDVWFGATALQALSDWRHLTDLSLWTCQLPDNFLDTLATCGLGVRLTKLRLSIVRSLSHDYLCAMFARCPHLEAFSLIYSVDDHFHCPRSITADTVEALWRHCPSLVEVELMDCDHVDLTLVIPSMHRYMHSKRPDLDRTAPTLELSYKTRLNIRLRSLTRLGQCCMRISRRRDDLFVVTLGRHCARP